VGFGRHSATWIPQIHPGVLDAEEVELLRKAEAWRITLHVADGAILYEPRAGGEAGRIWLNVIKPEVDAWIAAHRAELLTALGKGYRPWGEAPSSAAVGGGAVTRYCTLLLEGMNISVAVSGPAKCRPPATRRTCGCSACLAISPCSPGRTRTPPARCSWWAAAPG
jgi:hypothetical protein